MSRIGRHRDEKPVGRAPVAHLSSSAILHDRRAAAVNGDPVLPSWRRKYVRAVRMRRRHIHIRRRHAATHRYTTDAACCVLRAACCIGEQSRYAFIVQYLLLATAPKVDGIVQYTTQAAPYTPTCYAVPRYRTATSSGMNPPSHDVHPTNTIARGPGQEVSQRAETRRFYMAPKTSSSRLSCPAGQCGLRYPSPLTGQVCTPRRETYPMCTEP